MPMILVAIANRSEPMGDDEYGSVLDDPLHVRLDHSLTLIIESAGRFIEDKDRRIGCERTCNRDALTLAAGEVGAALFDDCIVAEWQLRDELVGTGQAWR